MITDIDIVATLDEQDRIIKLQEEMINRLSKRLLQYITLDELESVIGRRIDGIKYDTDN